MAATVAGAFGARVDPAKLVPEQYRGDQQGRPRPKTPAEEEREAELGWRILEHGLRAV